MQFGTCLFHGHTFLFIVRLGCAALQNSQGPSPARLSEGLARLTPLPRKPEGTGHGLLSGVSESTFNKRLRVFASGFPLLLELWACRPKICSAAVHTRVHLDKHRLPELCTTLQPQALRICEAAFPSCLLTLRSFPGPEASPWA